MIRVLKFGVVLTRTVAAAGPGGVRVRVHGGDRQQTAAQFFAAAAHVHVHVRLQFPAGRDGFPGGRSGWYVGRVPLHLLAPQPHRQEGNAPQDGSGARADAHRPESGRSPDAADVIHAVFHDGRAASAAPATPAASLVPRPRRDVLRAERLRRRRRVTLQRLHAVRQNGLSVQRRQRVYPDAATGRRLPALRLPHPPPLYGRPQHGRTPLRHAESQSRAQPAGHNGLQFVDEPPPAQTNQHRVGQLQSHPRFQRLPKCRAAAPPASASAVASATAAGLLPVPRCRSRQRAGELSRPDAA